MLSPPIALKPAPRLRLRGVGLRLRIGPDAFGNALGSSLADTINGYSTQSRIAADQMRSGQEDAAAQSWAFNNQPTESINAILEGNFGSAYAAMNSRSRTPGGYAVSLGNDATAEAADNRKVLGFNGDGSAYFAGNGGFTFRGLQTDTNYSVLAKPDWLNPAGGLSYTFDSAGTTFWRDNLTGEVMSPVAPYALPSKSDLETQAFWNGIKDDVLNLPANMVNGASDLVHGRVTVDGFIAGIVQSSPVGMFGAMVDGNYYSAGQRAVGTAAGLAMGYATEVGFNAAAHGYVSMRSSINAMVPDVNIAPFAPELSTGSSIRMNPNYGVTFFGDDIVPFYGPSKATVGNPNGAPTFFMPLEDSALVKSAHDAAVYTGMAPSAKNAYLNGRDIYGYSFPTDNLTVTRPTALDANGWPHYLEGGKTAVRLEGPNAGYMVTPAHEFVTPGNTPVPSGSVLFKLGPHGEWIPLRKW